MDTSEQYIKMCEKAEKIQGKWKPQEGDWIVEKGYRDVPLVLMEGLRAGFITGVGWEDDDPFDHEESIWLPRQDQLQEMVVQYPKDEPWVTFTLLRDFVMALPNARSVYTEQFTSWEQLWLAFVMKEKYNKMWNGEGWL